MLTGWFRSHWSNAGKHAAVATVILCLAMAMIQTMARAEAGPDISFSVGYQFHQGDYGQMQSSELVSLPFTLQYAQGRWFASATLSYLQRRGDAVSLVTPGTSSSTAVPLPVRGNANSNANANANVNNNGNGNGNGNGNSVASEVANPASNVATPVATDPPQNTETAAEVNTPGMVESQLQGWGDPQLLLGYRLWSSRTGDAQLSVSGGIKLAQNDADSGLGTGADDFSLQIDGSFSRNQWTPFITVGYLMPGESDSATYRNVVFTTAGVSWQARPNLGLSVSIDYQQPFSALSQAWRVSTLSADWRWQKQRLLSFSGSVGHTASSPDQAFAMTLTQSF